MPLKQQTYRVKKISLFTALLVKTSTGAAASPAGAAQQRLAPAMCPSVGRV
jgi:hypothetical protein